MFSYQKDFFKSQKTQDLDWRLEQLELLLKQIESYEDRLMQAVYEDMGRPQFETYTSELLLVKRSIRHSRKNLKKWAKPQRKSLTPLMIGKTAHVQIEARGQVLIIAPYNYPIQLTLLPLMTALSAGNTVVLKPSEACPRTGFLLKRMLEEIYPKELVTVILADGQESEGLLDYNFDFIFFTGSQKTGKIIAQKALKHQTPYILELGGKSPALVLENADLKTSAERIAWGKFLNAGQTCVAPDYVLVDKKVYFEFIEQMKSLLDQMYPSKKDFTHRLSKNHVKRLVSYLEANQKSLVYGGSYNDRQVFPSLLAGKSIEGGIVEEEIFGPILPIIPFDSLAEMDSYLDKNPNPLAFYVFTEDESFADHILSSYSFGGGVINDTVLHLAHEDLPFGGIKESGQGAYHGQEGFMAFSHQKSILKSSTAIKIPFLYPPYKKRLKYFRKMFK